MPTGAAENLPALRERLIKIRKTAEKAETSMIAVYSACNFDPLSRGIGVQN